MAQRYELQVNEQSPAGAFIQAPSVNASQIGAGIASIGGVIGQWGAFMQKRQDEWDAATVINAQTEFQKQMNDWLYNPDNGQTVTRKLGSAKDLTIDTDEYSNKLIKDISGKLENDNQRIAFRNTAEKLKMPYWEQASRHEAREFKQFKDQSYASGIQVVYDAALANPEDGYARASAMTQFDALTRAHMLGADETTINQEILCLQ